MQTTFTRVAGHRCEVTSFLLPAPTEGDTRLTRMIRDGYEEYVKGMDKNADGNMIGGWQARVRAVPLPLADDSEFMREPYYGFFNVYVTRVNGTSHLFAIDTRGVTPEIDDGRGNTEKYFGGNMLQDLVPERNPARDICRPKDVLVGECFGAADFLMHHTVLAKRAARASACLKGLSIDNKDPPTDIRLPTLGELTRWIHQPTEREVDAASVIIFIDRI